MFEIKEVNSVEATGSTTVWWGLTVLQGALTAGGWWALALAGC